jgi:hypothetical protein
MLGKIRHIEMINTIQGTSLVMVSNKIYTERFHRANAKSLVQHRHAIYYHPKGKGNYIAKYSQLTIIL